MSTSKTATLNVRIEPNTKAEAEQVFRGLGISMSDAINIFLRQVAYRRAIPFELEIPMAPAELNATNWSKEKLMAEVKKGIKSTSKDKDYSIEEVFGEILGA